MRVIGVSGMPGSGKSIISDKCVEKGAIIVSMGDIIREEAKKRGETTGETAVNLRKEHGEYIVSELTIKKIKWNDVYKLDTVPAIEWLQNTCELLIKWD